MKLLHDLLVQLRFKKDYGPINNGDLQATWSQMRKRGWRSQDTMRNAIDELKHYGFIVVTRQGYMNRCSLYAVTWWAINECNGKLDVSETQVPGNNWKKPRERWISPRKQKQQKKAHTDYSKNRDENRRNDEKLGDGMPRN